MAETHNNITWMCLPWSKLDLLKLYTILKLRQEVFVVEQNCPYLDADGEDHKALHLCGWIEQTLCCYARIFPPNTQNRIVIGRVIVHQQYRGHGLGYILMQQAHHIIQARFDSQPSFVSAQQHLASFYQNLGYQQIGAMYLEDGIPHIPMLRD